MNEYCLDDRKKEIKVYEGIRNKCLLSYILLLSFFLFISNK